MSIYQYGGWKYLILTTALLSVSMLTGCTVVGPKYISRGRADYNEVINRTEDEQILLSIIKGRYGETSSLLVVSSVAANVRFSTTAGIQEGISISTRSTFDLIEILRAAAIVPQEHIHAGLTISFPPTGLPGRGIRIYSSTQKPKNSTIAVKHRGYWFYIDDSGQETKEVFRALRTLWSFSTEVAEKGGEEPILTIPVNR